MALFSRGKQQPQLLSDVVARFGPRARRVFSTAHEISSPYRQLDSGAFLAALCDEPAGGAGIALYESGVRIDPTLAALAALEPPRDHLVAKRPMAPVMHRVFAAAMDFQRRRDQPHVNSDLLLEALLNESDSVAVAMLASQSVAVGDLRKTLRRVVGSGHASDDFVFRTGEPVIESIDLAYPASLVWELIERPENVPLLDENAVSGERRFDAGGQEFHVLHTRYPAPNDLLEYSVTVEAPGRRARILQTSPASPRATPTTSDVTPVGNGSRLQLESLVEVGWLRRREFESAEPELRRHLRMSLDNTRRVLDEGWLPNAGH